MMVAWRERAHFSCFLVCVLCLYWDYYQNECVPTVQEVEAMNEWESNDDADETWNVDTCWGMFFGLCCLALAWCVVCVGKARETNICCICISLHATCMQSILSALKSRRNIGTQSDEHLLYFWIQGQSSRECDLDIEFLFERSMWVLCCFVSLCFIYSLLEFYSNNSAHCRLIFTWHTCFTFIVPNKQFLI